MRNSFMDLIMYVILSRCQQNYDNLLKSSVGVDAVGGRREVHNVIGHSLPRKPGLCERSICLFIKSGHFTKDLQSFVCYLTSLSHYLMF